MQKINLTLDTDTKPFSKEWMKQVLEIISEHDWYKTLERLNEQEPEQISYHTLTDKKGNTTGMVSFSCVDEN